MENNNIWAEEVAEYIERSGRSMRSFAMDLGIPYRTLQDWRAGRRVADPFIQECFRAMMTDYFRVWLKPLVGGPQIVLEGFETLEDALASLDGSYCEIEISRPGDNLDLSWSDSLTYAVFFHGKDTGYRVLIK